MRNVAPAETAEVVAAWSSVAADGEGDDEGGAALPPQAVSHQEVWKKLVAAGGNRVEFYFPQSSRLVNITCNRVIVGLGVLCSVWAGVTEITLAIEFPGKENMRYISGMACFGLMIGTMLTPTVITGSWWRANPLISDNPDRPTYYEMLDVLIKDIEGTTQAQNGSRPMCSFPLEVVKVKQRTARINKIQEKVRHISAVIFICIGLAGAGCSFFVVTDILSIYNLYPHTSTDVKRAYRNGCDTAQTVMWLVSTLSLSVGTGVLCLASYLHRTQTELFVEWLEELRFTPCTLRRDKPTEDANKPERDAIQLQSVAEGYLFMRMSFQHSSNAWGGGLSCWIIVTGALAVVGCIGYMILPGGYVKSVCLGIGILNLVLCIVPIYILAYANGCAVCGPHPPDTEQSSFSHDYDVIGGRTKWVEYVHDNPTYWYIFGFAITRSWLLGFFSGVVTALGAVTLQFMTSL